jgi:hypothetical protein
LTVAANQRGTTVIGIRWRSIDGVVEKIFPVSGKFPAKNDPNTLNRIGAAMTDYQNRIACFNV